MDTVILDVYLITRRGLLPALIPVAGNYSKLLGRYHYV